MNEVLKDKLGKILNPKIPRYEKIVETISNDNGTAIKFKNGVMICFGKITIAINGGSDYYGVFNRTVSTPVNFPTPFISTENLAVNATSQYFGVFSINVNSINTNNFSFYGFYPTTVSFSSMNLSYVACGRWK